MVATQGYPNFEGEFELRGPDTRLEVGLIIPIVNGEIFPPALAQIDVRSVGTGNTIAVDAQGYPDFEISLITHFLFFLKSPHITSLHNQM